MEKILYTFQGSSGDSRCAILLANSLFGAGVGIGIGIVFYSPLTDSIYRFPCCVFPFDPVSDSDTRPR